MSKLSKSLKPEEFRQYYFLKEELKDFCRSEGLKVSGSKIDLENRIIHYLKTSEELAEDVPKQFPARLPSEISLDSNLGENFKCSEDKRAFFEKEIGKGFKFKVKFQKWLKSILKKLTGMRLMLIMRFKTRRKKQRLINNFSIINI